ncbi:MAG: AAA family ATPase [Phycisphaerae bacterium]
MKTIHQAGLTDALVEALLFKTLLGAGHATGRGLASDLGLPAKPIIEMLASLKSRQFIHHKDSTAMGDFEYTLTVAGRLRARTYMDECSYCGKAPVTLEAYTASVTAQSLTTLRPQQDDLRRAFSDLLINEQMFKRLGPAINSGRGLFLYGFPGNGKTSIAERIADCFGDEVWVPHAIHTGGEIIVFFDPENHEQADEDKPGILREAGVDGRWVRIRRPTIISGGELTMAELDLVHNPQTRITEPSLQLKSNTGILVIDDFGRQRMRPMELLNRWIVPLEKHYDFLTLSNGKKIKVPFDQLIIFSTNLEPKELVDEAFLRRIPYKINVIDPTEEEFRKLFEITGSIVGVQVSTGAVDYLIEKHYKSADRPFRCCQPRDLLLQVRSACAYTNVPAVATEASLDDAVENYFAVM